MEEEEEREGRGRSARRPGPRRGRRVVPANLLRENGSRGGRGLIDCLRFVVVIRRLASSCVGVLGKGVGGWWKEKEEFSCRMHIRGF